MYSTPATSSQLKNNTNGFEKANMEVEGDDIIIDMEHLTKKTVEDIKRKARDKMIEMCLKDKPTSKLTTYEVEAVEIPVMLPTRVDKIHETIQAKMNYSFEDSTKARLKNPRQNISGLTRKEKYMPKPIIQSQSDMENMTAVEVHKQREPSPELEIVCEKSYANKTVDLPMRLKTPPPSTSKLEPQSVPGSSSATFYPPVESTISRASAYTLSRLNVTPPRKPRIHRGGIKRNIQGEAKIEVLAASGNTTQPGINVLETIPEEAIPKVEYLNCFKTLVTEVWGCEQNLPLFDAFDIQVFSKFFALSDLSKALYVQLFKMKQHWRRIGNMRYDDIAPDLGPIIKELTLQDFFDNSDELRDLRTMLELLRVPELKTLATQFNVPSLNRKQQIIENLLDHAKSQRSIFSIASTSSAQQNLTSIITQRVKEILGPCIRLTHDSSDSLFRVCLLYSLPNCLTDDWNISKVLLTIFRSSKKIVIYPSYQIQRSQLIFKEKDFLLRFQQAHMLYLKASKCYQEKAWERLISITYDGWTMFKEVCNNASNRVHDSQLPQFLRRYTAGEVLASTFKIGLDALGRRKLYVQIAEILRDLLGQTIYKIQHRGMWYEKLALVLQAHLKEIDQAAETVVAAMEDPFVDLVSKIGFAQRASTLLKRKSWKPSPQLKLKISSFTVPLVTAPSTITITARTHQREGGLGHKLDYIHEGADGDEVTVSSVEELAISYYKRNEGYTEGLHAEGSSVVSLFGLLMWDIIYDYYVPDAFLNAYQETPLDLLTSEFYSHREASIKHRLAEMESWSDDEALIFLYEMWEQHNGKVSIVSWNMFQSVDQAQELMVCIGMRTMAGICDKLSRNFRVSRSGFPDILMWTPGEKRKSKFIEVKGPNDHLSSNQKVWIDHLIRIGAKVEVCFVKTVAAKYLGNIGYE